METFKLSPGRIGWIGLLCLLGVVAPRVSIHRPVESLPSAENESEEPRPTIQPAKQLAASHTNLLKTGELFLSAELPRLRIELSRAEMSKLRRYHWQWGGNTAERENAKATVYEGDTVYTNVSMHLKGSAGSFQKVDDKPSLTL